MDGKTQILIGMGAAIGAKCQICFDKFMKMAESTNIEQEDIKSAISISKQVSKKALTNMNNFVSANIEATSEERKANSASEFGCCG
jgi:cobalamin biosynthesis protein CbiG